jgi:transcriptional regulator with XRE-family HTH domain
MNINARLRQARKAAGISQSRLAAILGVTRSACSQWESDNGTVPRNERLLELASLLGVSYEWLATGRKPKEEKGNLAVRENTPPQYHVITAVEQEELLKLYSALPVKKRLVLLEFLRLFNR